MKYFSVFILASIISTGCNRVPDKETLELYEAYLDQYNSLSSHIQLESDQDRMINKEDTAYTNYIKRIYTYIYRNDSLLHTQHVLGKHAVDSICTQYNALLDEIRQPDINPCYYSPFPLVTGNEDTLETELKIRESNLRLGTAYLVTLAKTKNQYPFQHMGNTINPLPSLVSEIERNDSVIYSFLFGCAQPPYFLAGKIETTDLRLNGIPFDKKYAQIKTEKGHTILYLKTPEKGLYEWEGRAIIHYSHWDKARVEHFEFNCQQP